MPSVQRRQRPRASGKHGLHQSAPCPWPEPTVFAAGAATNIKGREVSLFQRSLSNSSVWLPPLCVRPKPRAIDLHRERGLRGARLKTPATEARGPGPGAQSERSALPADGGVNPRLHAAQGDSPAGRCKLPTAPTMPSFSRVVWRSIQSHI